MLRELGEQVRTGETSAVELVRRAFERVGSINAAVNAVIGLRDEDEALAEARALDDRVRAGEAVGLLAGVPFLVKDNHDLAGMRTTQGTRVLADAPPAARDSLCVARLRAAGAIPIGKTNVPEFCFEGFTANRAFGVTTNPWAPEWTPGGSSGGSAAAMAAGMIPFATATDGGGSIRIPASFCGLFGIKPTNGLVGRQPVPAWIDYSTDGPIALSMDDLRLLLAIQCGPAPGDPTALPAGLAVRIAGLSDAAVAGAATSTAGARRGMPGGRKPSLVLAAPRFVDAGPLPGALPDLFDVALTSLEKGLGLTVEPIAPVEIFGGGRPDEDWLFTCLCEQAAELGRETIEAKADLFEPWFLEALREALDTSLEAYVAARRRRFDYARRLDELLGEDRLLVTPTNAVEGIYADGREIGAAEPGTESSSFNTGVQNLTGHPALTVPAGVSPNGVPFGLQITGPRFADELVLAVGSAWEQAHPGPRIASGFAAFAAG
jgi:Asp-tRNA(Asn)/Glu-tRNA(Gln) amidotransferase A subunit family amidase